MLKPLLAAVLLLSTPASACTGDCDGGGTVTVNELVRGVRMALGSLPSSNCPSFDLNRDGTIQVNELVAAVGDALNGCGARTPCPLTFTTSSEHATTLCRYQGNWQIGCNGACASPQVPNTDIATWISDGHLVVAALGSNGHAVMFVGAVVTSASSARVFTAGDGGHPYDVGGTIYFNSGSDLQLLLDPNMSLTEDSFGDITIAPLPAGQGCFSRCLFDAYSGSIQGRSSDMVGNLQGMLSFLQR